MFCKKCGATLPDNARFCGACGTQQDSMAQPSQGMYQNPVNQLDFTVFGGNFPAVTIRLGAGESIYTQSGGLSWMDSGVVMETNMQGGLMKGLGRMFSGESLFMATFTGTAPGQELTIASSFPGSILPLELSGRAIIAQKSSFLCAQPSVELSAYVTKSIGAGLFGGEGFILQKLTGSGYVFLEIDGSLVERDLAPGEQLKGISKNLMQYSPKYDIIYL